MASGNSGLSPDQRFPSTQTATPCFRSNSSNSSSKPATCHEIDQPGPFDILCGKDRSYDKHYGNQMFRAMIAAYGDEYCNAVSKREKMEITKVIVHLLQTKYNARFIKWFIADTDTKKWYEISDRNARDKVSHALRFASRMLSPSLPSLPQFLSLERLTTMSSRSSQSKHSQSSFSTSTSSRSSCNESSLNATLRSSLKCPIKSSVSSHLSGKDRRRSSATLAAIATLRAFDAAVFYGDNGDSGNNEYTNMSQQSVSLPVYLEDYVQLFTMSRSMFEAEKEEEFEESNNTITHNDKLYPMLSSQQAIILEPTPLPFIPLQMKGTS